MATAKLLCLAGPSTAQFPAMIELADLDGTNGFASSGFVEAIRAGSSPSNAVDGDDVLYVFTCKRSKRL